MVSKEDVFLFAPVIFLLIIIGLGLSGVFYAGIAGPPAECDLGTIVCNVGAALGFPENWLNSKTFLWYSFIPLMGIWLIIFGFLDRIHIFRRNSINGLLSFLIAFSMVPLGVFVIVVSILFSIMGMYSVILFVGLFFIGTFYFAKGYIRGWRGVTESYDKAISECDKPIREAERQINYYNNLINTANTTGKIKGKRLTGEALTRSVEDLMRQRVYWEKRRDEWVVKKKTLEANKGRQQKMFMAESKA